MIKTFIVGLLLGAGAVVAALYTVPVVDQHREASIISLTPEGGPSEAFHVNIPMDRIAVGAQNRNNPLPPGMDWPDDELFSGMQTEVFKLRNSRDAVVGIATRLAANDSQVGNVIEWVLHLPARGSIYVTMASNASVGRRLGEIRAGTREFEPLVGRISERWVADSGVDGQAGRIELVMAFVSTDDPEPIGAPEEDDE